MSRFLMWNRALSGIINYLQSQGFILDIRNTAGKTDRFAGIEIPKIINAYSKQAKLKGSYTERIFMIQNDFNAFKKYITENKEGKFSKYLN